ncbi:MAG TPA: universal stress protein [Chloroflexaceae bacterium]|nr:universal stress protein [Chloroflexaceae bacterium]
MDRLLVPLDGSERSEQALPHAALFARLLEASVCLLHVVTADEQQSFAARQEQLRALYLPHWQPLPVPEAVRRHDEAYLVRKVQLLREAGVTAAGELACGDPAEAIVAATGQPDVAMVVMATHGRGGMSRWLLGSVAHKVLRLSSCPLLAVRVAPSRPPALRRILVPLDGSALAREALPMATALARMAGASLLLLTALTPLFGLDPSVSLAPGEAQLRAVRDRALGELQRVAAEHPDIPIVCLVGEGFAGATICREAERHGADLIVMAAHGHGGPPRFGLGSVTDKVLHTATVPVLVARERAVEPVGAAGLAPEVALPGS